MTTEEITFIKRYFDTKHVVLCPTWLHEGVKWCKENFGNDYPLEDLKYEIFQQWTFLDLRDVEVPVLPPELSSSKKATLDGSYSLQMMHAVDILRPKYWQLQKIRNETPKNLEKDETASAKRVLLMNLTDGVQEIEAMEFKPIQALSLNLTPGVKIQITGPVDVRRGRMMLEERHVKVIGGQVDTLLVSNAAENVLAGRLELPLNPEPNSVQETGPEESRIELTVQQVTRPRTVPNVMNNLDMIDREIDELLEAERDMGIMQPAERHGITSDMFEDDLDFENIVIPTEKPQTDPNESAADFFEDINIESHLDDLDQQMNDAPMTIDRLLKVKLYGTFQIKVKYKSVVEKLRLDNDEYHLVIEVEDDTSTLITRVHNDVLVRWARRTATELISLKEAHQNNVPDALAKVLETMKTLKENLESLNGMVEVEVTPYEKYLMKVLS